MNPLRPPSLREALSRRIICVSGKGGVGKQTVSQAIARALSETGERTLWVGFEDPLKSPGQLDRKTQNLWHLNCEAMLAFEEYVGMKIGVPGITKLFLRNALMQYLARAAPGIHELVLLGKVWFERERHDKVVVAMPSTGYGLAMFHSVANFARLFQGGPVNRDAEKMLVTFGDPEEAAHVIVALPEEMPLQESLELDEFLRGIFPENRPAFVANRRFPQVMREDFRTAKAPADWPSPLASSALDYAAKRSELETHNLRIWSEAGIDYASLPFVAPPPGATTREETLEAISRVLALRIAGEAL